MPAPSNVTATPAARGRWQGLGIRLASAAVLVPAVLADVWLGRIWFDAFMAGLAVLAAREWVRLAHPGDQRQFGLHAAAGLLAAFAHHAMGPLAALSAVLVIWVIAVAATARRGLWQVAGVPYVALPVLALSLLRSDGEHGLLVIYWLFAVVWAADTLAFFAGRLIGGPKLAPRISPSKTWAGLGGAIAGAVVASLGVAVWAGFTPAPGLFLLAAALAVTEQAGDLFESALKRAHGVKDSGRLIPGHGGVLDRVDGLFAAAVAAALVGALAAGAGQAAAGLMRVMAS